MQKYTGWQWLLIDAANNYGHDKLLFEERIDWAEQNLHNLEALASQAETKPLYLKAVMAIRAAQRGEATGHMVGVDATCSGIQIMSVLTGCIEGAESTGLVNPNERADAYSKCTLVMNQILSAMGNASVNVSRGDAKKALMTSFYGSKEQPKIIFGEDTPELAAFYQAAAQIAPGAWELLQDLLASWQPYALSHEWKLPDGYDARVKVMKAKEVRVEVDELDHATFTYEFYENQGTAKGLANAANVVHSVDGYVLREMHRRCNYDRNLILYVDQCIQAELTSRAVYGEPTADAVEEFMTPKVKYYLEQYRRSKHASAVILPHLDQATVTCLDTEHLEALTVMVQGMLAHKPFPLVTVHDEFKAHPNNVNQVRWHYKEILAELADSDVLDDILGQIHGVPGTFNKLSFNLSTLIKGSNYGLC